MKTMTIIGLSAAGIGAAAGYLIYTERGRNICRQTGDFLQDQYQRGKDRLTGQGENEVEEIVQEALAEPHPDTVMAHAFEEAAA